MTPITAPHPTTAETTLTPRTVLAVLATVITALGLSACQTTSTPETKTSATPAKTDSITLADAYELGGYNPISGYAELGVSPMYEGLLGLESNDPKQLPSIKPVLAQALPSANEDSTQFRVDIRQGVKFHDGSKLDAGDVVATYREVLNPKSGSAIAYSYDMIKDVSAKGNTVTFDLKYPYSDFASRLLLGIVPSESLKGGLASESPLNTKPIGTGPYRLEKLDSNQAVWKANPDYWGTAPQVKTLTTVYVPDDAARVARLKTGEFDGSIIPPALAASFGSLPGMQVMHAASADWRAVSLPSSNAFTADQAARRAMNLAVDREALIKTVLAGAGKPAYTPVSDIYPAYNPQARFEHNLDEARQLLDADGWVPGTDGIRSKDGQRAAFTLAYNPNDSVRRDLSVAFAAQMQSLGVEVKLQGMTWDALEGKLNQVAVLLGGGDKPYSIDTQVYSVLHTRAADTSEYDNPGNFGSPQLDEVLDQARRATPGTDRDELYRRAQTLYLDNPNHVFLAFLQHTYVMREAGWNTGNLTVEPHTHGVNWGPWWNLGQWSR